ncbi:hypothetical protein PTSG_07815 [Salpingoeca rosetta]|uniref:CXXC-type zinc finger protein 1 n=1 Tax=Salpingoeca rosetta (strain ATCC 50818 / BSB-021) TaxID=946362 RepID=F2UGE8_SALR5|nr:uncharacterized protein PTSG_07815 [Salpingoeca rosetta]EGD75698.1 hypothetical protein PTSG_07815 [Salpingoeca rosetta]|eukprot:XP_004991619.1 hypothetical protein PTSG_07815 [Salpingoeca rosetta]
MSDDEQELYCICRRPEGTVFMICCEHCDQWFHGHCMGITKEMADNIELYYCLECRLRHKDLTIKYKHPPKDVEEEAGKVYCARTDCPIELAPDCTSKYCSRECRMIVGHQLLRSFMRRVAPGPHNGTSAALISRLEAEKTSFQQDLDRRKRAIAALHAEITAFQRHVDRLNAGEFAAESGEQPVIESSDASSTSGGGGGGENGPAHHTDGSGGGEVKQEVKEDAQMKEEEEERQGTEMEGVVGDADKPYVSRQAAGEAGGNEQGGGDSSKDGATSSEEPAAKRARMDEGSGHDSGTVAGAVKEEADGRDAKGRNDDSGGNGGSADNDDDENDSGGGDDDDDDDGEGRGVLGVLGDWTNMPGTITCFICTRELPLAAGLKHIPQCFRATELKFPLLGTHPVILPFCPIKAFCNKKMGKRQEVCQQVDAFCFQHSPTAKAMWRIKGERCCGFYPRSASPEDGCCRRPYKQCPAHLAWQFSRLGLLSKEIIAESHQAEVAAQELDRCTTRLSQQHLLIMHAMHSVEDIPASEAAPPTADPYWKEGAESQTSSEQPEWLRRREEADPYVQDDTRPALTVGTKSLPKRHWR